jgi:type VI protein secretion system component Hcp
MGDSFMKALTTVALLVLVSSSAIAVGSSSSHNGGNNRRAQPTTISVAVNGLACNTALGAATFSARSWAWGAENESGGSTGSGGGIGRASLSNLTLKKAFDACSGQLFRAVTTGRFSRDLVLTQRDGDGNVVALVELSDVAVVSWSVGSSVRDVVPDETVAFTFGSVCITSPGAARQCFDSRT